MTDFEPILPISEIAKLARTSRRSIYQLIYSGRLHAINLGAAKAGRMNWRIPLSSWKSFVSGGVNG